MDDHKRDGAGLLSRHDQLLSLVNDIVDDSPPTRGGCFTRLEQQLCKEMAWHDFLNDGFND